MTRKELEKMVSLVNDAYIDELYSAKIYDRKRFSPVKIISAAAVLAVVIGTGAIALNIGNSGNIPDIPPVTSELQTEFTDFTSAYDPAVTNAEQTASANNDDNMDYSVYFGIENFNGIIDYTLEAGGGEYVIDKDYASEILPFYVDVYDVRVYCGADNTPVNARIYYDNISLNSRRISADIIINDNGAIFPDYWTDYDDILENAPEYHGVKIAGYKLNEGNDGYQNLCAIFRADGIGYTVKVYGMTYKEAMKFIDSIIDSGLKAADIDITRGYKRFLSLEEANALEPYAGHIPALDKVGNMTFEECNMQRVAGDDMLYILYEARASTDFTNLTSAVGSFEVRKKIYLTYYTDKELFLYNIHKKDAPDELGINVSSYETEDVGDYKRYNFDFDMGGFYLQGEAVCTEEELTQYLSALMLAEEFGSYYKLLRPVPEKIPISEPYSEAADDFHKGINFSAPEGTDVYAAADGTVTVIDYLSDGYGKRVLIDHGNGIETLYAHLDEITVSSGDRVKKGDVIGLSGKTGVAESDTLHFEVRVNGQNVDPTPLLVSADEQAITT